MGCRRFGFLRIYGYTMNQGISLMVLMQFSSTTLAALFSKQIPCMVEELKPITQHMLANHQPLIIDASLPDVVEQTQPAANPLMIYHQTQPEVSSSLVYQQTESATGTISIIPFPNNTCDQLPGPSRTLPLCIMNVSGGDSITESDEEEINQSNSIDVEPDQNVHEEQNIQISAEDVENCSPNIVPKKRGPESVTVMKSTKKFASSELKFRSFQINWSKISDNILRNLQELQTFRNANPGKCAPRALQLTKADWSGLTNSVVDQLRVIDYEIQASIMEKVAKDILGKYPCLNFLDDDGYDTGTGFVWIKHKMLNRNSYLNRFKNDKPAPTKSEVRQTRNVRAGTNKQYWEKSSEECTKVIFSTLVRDEPDLLTEQFLQDSQSYVRFRFDEDKPLKDILVTFPVLRRKLLIDYHFESATGVSARSMEQYFTAKRSKLIDYSKMKHKTCHLDTATATDIDILRFLCGLLGEKIDDVIIEKEMGTKIDAIFTDCSGPVLVSIDCGNSNRIYYVFAEQVRLTEGTDNVLSAVSDLISVHYVHNFMYMRQISKFLEFVQEYFFKILPATGSKSNATRKGQQQRVVKNVVKSISEYCAQ